MLPKNQIGGIFRQVKQPPAQARSHDRIAIAVRHALMHCLHLQSHGSATISFDIWNDHVAAVLVDMEYLCGRFRLTWKTDQHINRTT